MRRALSACRKAACKLKQWRSLAGWERRVLLQMALLLPLAWVGLRLAGFQRLHRIALCKLPASHSFCKNDEHFTAYADRSAQLTATAALHCLPSGSCLPQSLALCWLLRKKGLDAHIRIGVKPQTGPLMAHAWVEYQAMALGQQQSGYTAFPHLSSSSTSAR